MRTLIFVITLLLAPGIQGHAIEPTAIVNQHNPENIEHTSIVLEVSGLNEYQQAEDLKPEATTESDQYKSTIHVVSPTLEYPNAKGASGDNQEKSTVYGVSPLIEFQYNEGLNPEATTEGGQNKSAIQVAPPMVEYPNAAGLKPAVTAEGSQERSTVHGVSSLVEYPQTKGLNPERTTEGGHYKSTVHGLPPIVEHTKTGELKPDFTTDGGEETTTDHAEPTSVEYPHPQGVRQVATTESGGYQTTITVVPPLTDYLQTRGPKLEVEVTTESGQDKSTVSTLPPLFEYPKETTTEGGRDKSSLKGSSPFESRHDSNHTPLDENHESAHHEIATPQPEPTPYYMELKNQSRIFHADTGKDDRAGQVPGENDIVHDQTKDIGNSRHKNWGSGGTKKDEMVKESYAILTLYERQAIALNNTHFGDRAVPSETIEFDRTEPVSNKTQFDVESTNQTESESIKEMLDKLNFMIEKHKQCNHNLEPDIDPAFNTTRSDIQGDSDTEENNETKRTIKEIIEKLNGIMFYGSRCIKDKNETEDNETRTFTESSVRVVTGQPSDKLKNETKNEIKETEYKFEQKLTYNNDSNDTAEDIFDHDNLDWTVFEHYPQEPKIRVIFDIECRDDLEEKKTEDELIDYESWHVKQNLSHRRYHPLHWDQEGRGAKTNCENNIPLNRIKEDYACPSRSGYRRPCFDIMSQESVLSQLCERLSSVEVDLSNVTSRVDFQRHQAARDRSDVISSLRSEILELKKKTEHLRRKSTFYASAYLNLGQIQDYTVQINQGEWFDPFTGMYTAPISGVYHIFLNQHNQIDVKHFTLHVKVGGSPEIVVISGKLSESLNTLVHLDTGQTMWLEGISDDPENNGVILNGLVSFGAYKVD